MWPDGAAASLKSELGVMVGVGGTWNEVADPDIAPRVAVAPYRVCPLGAHIDHQGGSVTALALDRGVLAAFVPSRSGNVRMRSANFEGEVSFSVTSVPKPPPPPAQEEEQNAWGNYARGACWALESYLGRPLSTGVCALLCGEAGAACAGISSSAATGVALLMAFAATNNINLSHAELIELDRAVENGYLGLRNGVLDQSAVLLSQPNELLRLNCKTRCYETMPTAGGISPPVLLLAFSGIYEALTTGTGYNRRVSECEAAATLLLAAAGRAPPTSSAAPVLSDVTSEEYEKFQDALDPISALRAAHYFTENARVEMGVEAWARADWTEFGALMTASGQSSIDLYQCGCGPLVTLRRILLETPGVLGARFSGAGFRGCVLAICEPASAASAAAAVEKAYAAVEPELAAQGARVVVAASGNAARLLV